MTTKLNAATRLIATEVNAVVDDAKIAKFVGSNIGWSKVKVTDFKKLGYIKYPTTVTLVAISDSAGDLYDNSFKKGDGHSGSMNIGLDEIGMNLAQFIEWLGAHGCAKQKKPKRRSMSHSPYD